MTAQVETTDAREQARQVYRQSVTAEMPLTGKALGDMFERSERWGRDRIAEVRRNEVAAKRQAVPESGKPAAAANGKDAASDAAETAVIAAVASAERQERQEPAAAVEPERQPQRQAASDAASGKRHAASPAANGKDAASDAAEHKPGAYAVAWCSFAFGVVVSVAANIAHVFYPATEVLREFARRTGKPVAEWAPDLGAVIGAAFWPLALLLTVELLTRVAWPGGWRWALTRYVGTGLVAVVAAVMSYRHMAGLLAAWGEDQFSAHLGPLAVDGLMVVAGMALLAMSASRSGKRQ